MLSNTYTPSPQVICDESISNSTATLACQSVVGFAPPVDEFQCNNTGSEVQCAERLVAETPGAISQQKGHDRTFEFAIKLSKIGLDASTELALFSQWNLKCEPPWTDAELQHKLDDAHKTRNLPPPEASMGKRRLASRARRSLEAILRDYATTPDAFLKSSPVPMPTDPRCHWHLHLQLFEPDDIVWIGQKYHSAGAKATDKWRNLCRWHFMPARKWLAQPRCPSGPLVGKEAFKLGLFSRCKENIEREPFTVVESDDLSKAEICAIISWCRRFMRLRAIVDTAGKSLHGWFDRPEQSVVDELKTILPGLKCDKSVLTPSQPVRLAGAARGAKIQSLIYLDL